MKKINIDPFTFSDEKGIEAIEWFANAEPEDREKFLYSVGGYSVSDETWYVHPNKEVILDYVE